MGPENFDGTRVLLPPAFQWGGRVAAGANTPPSNVYPGFADYSSVNDFAASLTKVFGRHTIKTGYYRQKAAKRQNQGNPFGTLNFGNDANNPLDSGYGYANAALGHLHARTRRRPGSSRGSTPTRTTRPTSRTTGR